MYSELIYFFRKGGTALSGRTTKLCIKYNRESFPARSPEDPLIHRLLLQASQATVMGPMKEGSLTPGSDERVGSLQSLLIPMA